MSSKNGPRFTIGSSRPSGAGVMEELIGKTPASRPAPTSNEDASPPSLPTVAKFGNGGVPTLEECEQHISAVTTQWLLGVGRALRAIRDHELYRRGGYDSFSSYLRQRWDMAPPQATRVIQSVPVVEALQGRTDREIKEGQARILVPVEREHGADAVREVWDAAAHSGHPSAKALERIARAKGYLPPAEEEQQALPPTARPAPITEMQQALRAFSLPALREAAQQAPEAAQAIRKDCEEIATALLAFAAELAADLDGNDPEE
ncbi:hypothetical protein GCM10017673_38000 [Streptosporangium violaceochromogenes]|nr:hypothetical protein GCM10017673_38000 [Streptosporangium violaceochromogenes]